MNAYVEQEGWGNMNSRLLGHQHAAKNCMFLSLVEQGRIHGPQSMMGGQGQ